MARTAILYVTERCNQACVFCLEEDGLALRPDVPATQVCQDLAELRARGAQHLTFMGGETFLRKDLPALLAEARRVGFTRIGVTTNGTALSHPGFLERMIASGLDFVEMSVHSDDAAMAEAISGKPFTWERQKRALGELEMVRDRLHVIVNVVVCRQNHQRLLEVLSGLIDGYPKLRPVVKLKFVSVIGAADRAGSPPLRYDEVDLGPSLEFLRARGVAYWLYNFPLCRIPPGATEEGRGYRDAIARSHESQAFVLDWRYHDYDHRRRIGYYDSGFQLEGNVWPEPCQGCTLAPLCPGLEETYRRHHGTGELRARSEDPIAGIEAILTENGLEAGRARGVLTELAKRSRPQRFVSDVLPKPGEAALIFRHASWDEPIAFELGPADGRPAFTATPRLSLAYRRTTREPGSEPSGRALLASLESALTDADAAHEPLTATAERLAGAAVGASGWSCAEVRFGPPPPVVDAPIAIRVPSRR
jgi:organic radical activating enzyme